MSQHCSPGITAAFRRASLYVSRVAAIKIP